MNGFVQSVTVDVPYSLRSGTSYATDKAMCGSRRRNSSSASSHPAFTSLNKTD